ncbi:hypothetical protein [Nocardioides flavescens]|uniref:Uncharacterized protein n=1 Tax=Nocardioides flavescens TaxID=2691959 RepID=A0A6L7EWF0_9ACTN|nr:hypothetical protein [Nocardioides flavescens]MXG89718.1 hypothetical protein [Nocardioides flavescens]
MELLLRRTLTTVAVLTVTLLTALAVLTAASSGGATGAPTPVLGSPSYMAPYGVGWGTAHPRVIDNGGDPSGSVKALRWRSWGEPTTKARGLTPIFRPGGGYYRKPARIVLRATDLGTCGAATEAYTRLEFRVAKVPGGSVSGPWRPWAGSADLCGG